MKRWTKKRAHDGGGDGGNRGASGAIRGQKRKLRRGIEPRTLTLLVSCSTTEPPERDKRDKKWMTGIEPAAIRTAIERSTTVLFRSIAPRNLSYTHSNRRPRSAWLRGRRITSCTLPKTDRPMNSRERTKKNLREGRRVALLAGRAPDAAQP